MSVWASIVTDYVKAPTIKKLSDELPSSHKRCTACGLTKPRSEFYSRRGDHTNSVTPKCKPCHIEYSNAKRNAAYKAAREEKEKA